MELRGLDAGPSRTPEGDQISELLSAQFDLAAVVYERDSPNLGAVTVDHDLWNGVVGLDPELEWLFPFLSAVVLLS